MSTIKVVSMTGAEVGSVELNDAISVSYTHLTLPTILRV